MDAIDHLVMNARLHYLGSAARINEPVQKLAVLACMDARVDLSANSLTETPVPET
jgi:carbonic anhydrase